MTRRDVFSGQPGEWRGGMWFPDPKHPNPTMRDVHTRDISGDNYEHLERIAHEVELLCEEHRKNRIETIEARKQKHAWFAVFLIIGFFIGLWVIHALWGLV